MSTRVKVQEAIQQLNEVFVEREEAVQVIWAALLSGHNFILVGDPGTAKTALVKAAYSHVGSARVFATLCGAFATEDKIFGPMDIHRYKNGEYARVLKGRLADCELAFLDEMLKANDGTLNGMLSVLNERTYEGEATPLRICGAATNWPEVKSRSDNVAALWDRMLLRCEVREIKSLDKRLAMLEQVDKVAAYSPRVQITIEELDQARAEIAAIEVPESARRSLIEVQTRLEQEKITNTSRRLGALQAVLRASAWMAGRDKVLLDDFMILRHGLWADRDQVDAVEKIIESIDVDVFNSIMTRLQEANRQIAQDSSVGSANRLIKVAADAAVFAKDQLSKRGVLSKNRARIKAEIEKLNESYNRLKSVVAPHLAGAASVSGAAKQHIRKSTGEAI